MSTGLLVYLDGSSREEEPVASVWRVQVVLHEGGSVGSIDQQHVVQPPAGLIAFRALRDLLRPAEANAISPGLMWQGKQVDDSTAVGRSSRGEETYNIRVWVNVCVTCLCIK